jgi:hypothetical protein
MEPTLVVSKPAALDAQPKTSASSSPEPVASRVVQFTPSAASARIAASLPVPTIPKPVRAAPPVPAPVVVAITSVSAPHAPLAKPAPLPPSPPVVQVPFQAKPTRTIEDVRADLARLREAARERQAKLEVARDTSFAPTDFMDFAPERPRDTQSEPARPDAPLFPEFDMLKGVQRR